MNPLKISNKNKTGKFTTLFHVGHWNFKGRNNG